MKQSILLFGLIFFFTIILIVPVDAQSSSYVNITNSAGNTVRDFAIARFINSTNNTIYVYKLYNNNLTTETFSSGNNGSSWNIDLNFGRSEDFLQTQIGLQHFIFLAGSTCNDLQKNLTNNSVSSAYLIESSCLTVDANFTSTYFLPRRSGNITIISNNAGGTGLQFWESRNGINWINKLIPDNKTGGSGFTATETPDNYMYVFRSDNAHNSNWNVTNVSTSPYTISATTNLLTNKLIGWVASTSSLDGEIYATALESITPSVIWFSKMNKTSKEFSTPIVILNQSNLESNELVFDVNNNYIYLITSTNPESSCSVFVSTNRGNSWISYGNFSSPSCNRGYWLGRFPWDNANQLNSSRIPFLEGISYNTHASGYRVTYNNMSISSQPIQSGTVLGTDISQIFFDFETATVSFTNFTGADWRWTSDDRLITQLGQPDSIYAYDPENDFIHYTTMDCRYSNIIPWSSGNNIFPNNPAPPYFVICFNLSSQHFGLDTYGAIKIINNTNVRGFPFIPEFDFYWAYFPPQIPSAPTTVQFSNIIINPNPPQLNNNLFLSWLTSYPLTTQVYFSTIENGVQSVFTPLFADQNLSSYHNLTIDKQKIITDGMVLVLSGINQNGQEFNATPITLFITPNNQTNIPAPSNNTMGGAVNNIVNSGLVENASQATYLLGAILLIMMTVISFIFGGFKMGFAVFISMVHAETIIGWLPLLMIIPILVLDAFFITFLIRRVFAGEAGN